MTFDEWLKIGMDKGWCGPSICVTHDGVPMTEQEEEDLYEDDPCIHAIRLYEDEGVRLKVEENHSPTQWRASNSGYRRQDGERQGQRTSPEEEQRRRPQER